MSDHSIVRGLDDPCPTCQRASGDHTLREWATCIGTQTTDLPFEPVPDDLADAATENMRRSFDIPGDVIVADHVVIRALTLDCSSGPIRMRLPAVLHEFQVAIPGQPPTVVAKVLFAGNDQTVRGYGRLIRDSANGAVNAAGRGT